MIDRVFINMDWYARFDSTSYHLPFLPKAKTWIAFLWNVDKGPTLYRLGWG